MRQRFSALRMASVGLGGIALTATLAPAPAFAETVRSSVNRNVELVIGVTNVSSTQVKLGTVTVTLVDGLGHSGANYDFRLYIASTLIKNDNHTCTRDECARQWAINKTYTKGTVVIGRMVVPGGSDVGAPRITL